MCPQSNVASHRVAGVPPSGIRRFFDIAATMEDVISLGIGEPDFVTPEPILRAGIEALERGETSYTSNAGLIELRSALSDHLDRLYGVSYDPASELLVSVGVSEALYLALTAIINPGDEVIVPQPCFVSYAPEVVFAGGVPVIVPFALSVRPVVPRDQPPRISWSVRSTVNNGVAPFEAGSSNVAIVLAQDGRKQFPE